MCVLGLGPLLGLGGAGAATAAGATAAASTLSTIGTIVSVGGAIASGISGMNAAKQQSAQIEDQKRTEAQLTAVQDQRQRAKMFDQIAQQRAELAARGVTLDSVTAIQLGQTAAQELSFESQATRSGGAARQRELTAEQSALKAQGMSSLLKGTLSGIGSFITAAPDIWPGLRGATTA